MTLSSPLRAPLAPAPRNPALATGDAGAMPAKDGNRNLQKAKREKRDEYYTQMSDIEREMSYYRPHFAGKTVYCNCDDPRVSNFFRYFFLQFKAIGLRKLITSCYKSQNPDMFSQRDSEKAVYLEFDGKLGSRMPSPDEVEICHLSSDGDFRNPESIALLRQADIVVTNPPFSMFREFVAQLMAHDKKFIILGHQNAITYKEIFPLIQANKLWLGVDNGGNKWFEVNDDYDIKTESRKKIENGKKFFSMGNVVWFTNLDIQKRHEEIKFYRKYGDAYYPKYDNYDAIEVGEVRNIPADYAGAMGVPVTFLDKHNPDQFEILGQMVSTTVTDFNFGYPYINGQKKYARIIIRNKKPIS